MQPRAKGGTKSMARQANRRAHEDRQRVYVCLSTDEWLDTGQVARKAGLSGVRAQFALHSLAVSGCIDVGYRGDVDGTCGERLYRLRVPVTTMDYASPVATVARSARKPALDEEPWEEDQ